MDDMIMVVISVNMILYMYISYVYIINIYITDMYKMIFTLSKIPFGLKI